jgi:hypothetical protein
MPNVPEKTNVKGFSEDLVNRVVSDIRNDTNLPEDVKRPLESLSGNLHSSIDVDMLRYFLACFFFIFL